MKKLILIALVLYSPWLHAQRAIQKNPDTGALLDGFNTGSKTIEISSAGTLKFNSGFTLTGGSHLTSALGLVIGTDVQAFNASLAAIAAGTWTGASSITTLGTITTGTWTGTTIAVANGGTGSTTAANARTALGLAIGTDVQAFNASLAAIAAGTWTGASSITTLGTITTGTWTGTAIAIANGGTGSTTAANARTALGLAIGTNVQAYNSTLALLSAGTALPLANGGTGSTTAAGARGNLGVQPTISPVFTTTFQAANAVLTGSLVAAGATSAASGSVAMVLNSTAAGGNAVAIGASANASGSGAISIGGSTIAGINSFAFGNSNTVSADVSMAIGNSNTLAAGGGTENLAIGWLNSVTPSADSNYNAFFGYGHTLANTVTTDFSFVSGVAGNVRHSHERIHANNELSGRETQAGEVILTTTTTNATVTELAIDHTTATRFFTVGSGRVYDCLIRVVGRRSDGTQHAVYWRKVLIQRTGATTSLPTAIQTLGTDFESNAAWDIAVTADDTNDRLRIAVTGAAAVTIGWSAHIIFNELTY